MSDREDTAREDVPGDGSTTTGAHVRESAESDEEFVVSDENTSTLEGVASDPDEIALREEVESLRAENRRLRDAYAQSKRAEYRRTALALGGIGLLSVAAAILFPIAREVLLVLGAIGLFSAVLANFLTPERLVPETVERSVYESVSDVGDRLRTELGLQDEFVYVPTRGDGPSETGVTLFIPQSTAYDPRDAREASFDSLFVLPERSERRGIALRPTGAKLVQEFERSMPAGATDTVGERLNQLCDALVEQFELVDTADPDVDEEGQRATVAIRGGLTTSATEFDNPVASFVASGLAAGLDQPVTMESTRDGSRVLITCRWYDETGQTRPSD